MTQLVHAWPFGYQDFGAPTPEGSWALVSSAPSSLDQAFAAPEVPWSQTYWTPPELATNAAEVGGAVYDPLGGQLNDPIFGGPVV